MTPRERILMMLNGQPRKIKYVIEPCMGAIIVYFLERLQNGKRYYNDNSLQR